MHICIHVYIPNVPWNTSHVLCHIIWNDNGSCHMLQAPCNMHLLWHASHVIVQSSSENQSIKKFMLKNDMACLSDNIYLLTIRTSTTQANLHRKEYVHFNPAINQHVSGGILNLVWQSFLVPHSSSPPHHKNNYVHI
jgi:hypothetical protein